MCLHEKKEAITFTQKEGLTEANVCLVYDDPPFQGFYQVHKLFSVQKILSMLDGKVSYRDVQRCIEEACKAED